MLKIALDQAEKREEDDLIILPLLAALAIKLIPPEIMEVCKTEAETLWQNGKPLQLELPGILASLKTR